MKQKIILIFLFLFVSNLNGAIKICLIGGPGAGKTTILNAMKNLYTTIEEASSFLIRKALSKNQPHPLNDNPHKFQEAVAKTQIKLEKQAEDKKESIIIIDGGIPNNYVFCQFLNVQLPKEIQQEVDNHKKYDFVFFLDFPSKYKEDPINLFSHKEALKLHNATKEIYEKIGYELTIIPFFEKLEDRINFVKNKIKELTSKKS